MAATVSWVEGNERPVERATIAAALAQAAADSGDGRPIASVRSEGAEITIVVGDPTGTTLVYFPSDYAQTQVASLLSVGDRDAADANRWEPPLVADYFGHYTEFPRWSVVPHSLGEEALREFLEEPTEPPRSISWQSD